MGFYKLREWVGTETGKGDRLGGRRLGRFEPAFRVASTTALPPPTSTARQRLANFIGWLFCCKACAGRIVCWCFAARPVPVGSSASCLLQGLCRSIICRLFATAALSCHALHAHLCHAMPAAPIHFAPFCYAFPRPPCSLPCAPGSSRKLQGLPCWQLQHGPAVAARAPCCIHPSIRCVHCVCCLSQHGDCVCAAHAPLCSLHPC